MTSRDPFQLREALEFPNINGAPNRHGIELFSRKALINSDGANRQSVKMRSKLWCAYGTPIAQGASQLIVSAQHVVYRETVRMMATESITVLLVVYRLSEYCLQIASR